MNERLRAMLPWLLRLVGFPLLFGFFFVIFAYYTFPYDRLRDAIVAAAEAPRPGPRGGSTPSGIELSIGNLEPTWLPGLHAQNVEVTFLPQLPGQTARSMRMRDVYVRVGLLALLRQRLNLDLLLDGIGGAAGSIETHLEANLAAPRAGVRVLHMQFTDVRVGELPPLVNMVGLPLAGTLAGNVDFTVPDGYLERSTGNTRLTVRGLAVGDGRAQFPVPRMGGITIERINAGDLEVAVTIREGVATIDRLAARSREFELQGDGRVALRPDPSASDLNFGIRFRLTEAYRDKSEIAGRIFTVLSMVPDLQAARRPDGMMAFRCRGTPERGVNCPPDPRGGSAPPPTRRGFD